MAKTPGMEHQEVARSYFLVNLTIERQLDL